MIDLVVNLLIFQLLTSRYNPLFTNTKSKKNKVITITTALLFVFVAQLVHYLKFKPLNYYEYLQLQKTAYDPDAVDAQHTILSSLNESKEPVDVEYGLNLQESYECLITHLCANMYQRFGNGNQAKLYEENNLIDWRLGANAVFYLVFTFVQGTMASHEQKKGLRIAMGIGIVFCFMEVNLIKSIERSGLRGMPMDENVKWVMSLFPSTYCAFEMVNVLRIFYMLLFNISCLISIVFIENEGERNIEYAKEIKKNGEQIALQLKALYKKQTGDSNVVFNDLMKTEKFKQLREDSMSTLDLEFEALLGQTDVESIKAKKKRNTTILHCFGLFVVVMSTYRHLDEYGYLKQLTGAQ